MRFSVALRRSTLLDIARSLTVADYYRPVDRSPLVGHGVKGRQLRGVFRWHWRATRVVLQPRGMADDEAGGAGRGEVPPRARSLRVADRIPAQSGDLGE